MRKKINLSKIFIMFQKQNLKTLQENTLEESSRIIARKQIEIYHEVCLNDSSEDLLWFIRKLSANKRKLTNMAWLCKQDEEEG